MFQGRCEKRESTIECTGHPEMMFRLHSLLKHFLMSPSNCASISSIHYVSHSSIHCSSAIALSAMEFHWAGATAAHDDFAQ